MGKPFNDQEGSGFHLHLSLLDEDGANVFADGADEHGCSDHLRHFTAGLLEHAPALMAVLNPTINAYRRIDPHMLVPTRACWGYDNRFAFVRIPAEHGAATRVELRLADAHREPLPGHGRRALRRPRRHAPRARAAGAGARADLRAAGRGDRRRRCRGACPRRSPRCRPTRTCAGALGERLVQDYLELKTSEIERNRLWVSDWDFAEYAHHL